DARLLPAAGGRRARPRPRRRRRAADHLRGRAREGARLHRSVGGRRPPPAPAAAHRSAPPGGAPRRRRVRDAAAAAALRLSLARRDVARLDTSPPPRHRLRLEAFHPMGTARMDADPRRGAVAPDGALHGADALYVADGSLLPSSIGVNPMLTIIAMAARVARQVADRVA